jgi:hypothetical protein
MQRNVLLTCLALAACTGTPADGEKLNGKASVYTRGDQLTYYKDIKPIFEEKCNQCHTKGGMGHFSLSSFAEVEKMAPVIHDAVESERMPPWRPIGPPGQYQGDRRLSGEQKAKILDWIDQGTPVGDPADEPPDIVKGRRGLPRVDLSLPIPETYTPTDADTDDYRCFPLDWTPDSAKYIMGLGIEPGDKELVHHAIVYLVGPEGVSRVRQNDAADPALGYECMGGPGSWLQSYEPGGYGEENPGGVAFEFTPGSLLVLQVHYNTIYKKGADRSRVDLMLADKADRVGAVHLVMNPSWPGRRMAIPAGQADVVHKWQGRPSGLVRGGTYELFWADLHAHTRATSAKMGIVRAATGERENLLEIPEWDFDWQETFNFVKPVRLEPNDQLYVECHFDNTASNQPFVNGEQLPARDINWGERTTDEMCLGNVLGDRLPDPPQPDAGASDAGRRSGISFGDGGFTFPRRDAGLPSMDAGVPSANAELPEEVPENVEAPEGE